MTEDGGVWIWGTGREGQLGLGKSRTFAPIPRLVPFNTEFDSIIRIEAPLYLRKGNDKEKETEKSASKIRAIFSAAGEYNTAIITSVYLLLYSSHQKKIRVRYIYGAITSVYLLLHSILISKGMANWEMALLE